MQIIDTDLIFIANFIEISAVEDTAERSCIHFAHVHPVAISCKMIVEYHNQDTDAVSALICSDFPSFACAWLCVCATSGQFITCVDWVGTMTINNGSVPIQVHVSLL